MSKRTKKEQRYLQNTKEVIGSEVVIYPEATLTPDASLEKTGYGLISTEITTAPDIGEEDEKKDSEYASTLPALVDKYLLSNKIPFSITLIICAIVSGFIYIHDNNTGKLESLVSIKWTLIKCGIFFLLILVFWIFLYVTQSCKSLLPENKK